MEKELKKQVALWQSLQLGIRLESIAAKIECLQVNNYDELKVR